MRRVFNNSFFISLYFIFVSHVSISQNLSLVVSRVGSQDVFANEKMEVYFSTLNNTQDVEFSGIDLPQFGQVITFPKGDGKFVFQPSGNDTESYTIGLRSKIIATGAEHTQYFKLIVKNPGQNLLYIDPVYGNDTNDGSYDNPFKSLNKILEWI